MIYISLFIDKSSQCQNMSYTHPVIFLHSTIKYFFTKHRTFLQSIVFHGWKNCPNPYDEYFPDITSTSSLPEVFCVPPRKLLHFSDHGFPRRCLMRKMTVTEV